MLSNFSYLNDLLSAILANQDLPVNTIYLSGSRKSGKTFSVYELFANLLILPDSKIRIYAFRKNQKDIKESIYEELWNAIDNIGYKPHENKTRKLIKFNNNSITFHSLHDRDQKKKKLSGLAGTSKFDYVFIHLEEAHEYEQQDIEDIREAIRGAKNICWIYSLNPWTKSHWLVSLIDNVLPFKLNIMKTTGYQLLLHKDKIYHYSNVLINDKLTPIDREQLDELEVLNPQRAMTAKYGYPSIEAGAIYSHAIKKVHRYIRKDITNFQAGIDFGFKQDATTLILIGSNALFKDISVIKEYYHSNSFMNFKDNEQLCKDIINSLIDSAKQFPLMYRGLAIYCDTSNYTMIEILNKLTQKLNITWLWFKPCTKIMVELRVGLQIALMESERLYVNTGCNWFMKELELARWKPNIKGMEVLDVDNHTQDAFHYAFTPWFNYLKASVNKYMFV